MRDNIKKLLKIFGWLSFLSMLICFFLDDISVNILWFSPFIQFYFFGSALLLLILTGISSFYKRKYLFHLGVVFLTSLFFFKNHYAISPTKSTSTDIKVMGFNTRLFDIYNWVSRESWSEWAPRTDNNKIIKDIYKMIDLESPDILCLQEFYFQKNSVFASTDSLKKSYRYQHVNYISSDISHHVRHHYGIATFSKFPIIHKETHSIKEGFQNGALVTDIVKGLDTLRILNVHFESYRLDKKNYQLLESIDNQTKTEINLQRFNHLFDQLKKGITTHSQEIKKISEIIENSPYPIILSCDLNELPGTPAYHELKQNLEDAFISSGSGISKTYVGNFPIRIDYLFSSKELTSYNYKVINSQELSDHYPIVSDFKLKP